MACKKCASIRQQEFPGELSVIFPGFQRLKRSPVYINQTIFVCLDCGFTELVIPGSELDLLKDGLSASGSRTA